MRGEQLELFAMEAVEARPAVPPFTVWTTSALNTGRCGWCGSKNRTGVGAGGGAGHGHGEDSPWYTWQYCPSCAGKYGPHVSPHRPGWPLLIDGTRPALSGAR